MNLLITICARGGSKGIPGKNIKELNGKPVIAYSIEIAQSFAAKYDGFVALSTDSLEIKRIAKEYGLVTDYLRPDILSGDAVGKVPVIRDIKSYHEKRLNDKFNYVLDLDVTSPLRTFEDLKIAYEMLLEKPEAYNIFSVNPASRNPYFNMVEESNDGYVKLVKDQGIILSRQMAPKVYDMNASFYFFNRNFFTDKCKTNTTSKSLVYVMPHICFDLDEPIDFLYMQFLLEQNLLDFQI